MEEAIGQQINVLIVDDNDLVVQAFIQFLENITNITVVGVCFDGSEVLSFIKYNKVDLIFMDIVMKNVDGYKAIKMVKAFNSSIKIIGFSIISYPCIINKLKETGADGFISKYDMDIPTLRIEINKVLGIII